jgi:chromosome segregation ATPase
MKKKLTGQDDQATWQDLRQSIVPVWSTADWSSIDHKSSKKLKARHTKELQDTKRLLEDTAKALAESTSAADQTAITHIANLEKVKGFWDDCEARGQAQLERYKLAAEASITEGKQVAHALAQELAEVKRAAETSAAQAAGARATQSRELELARARASQAEKDQAAQGRELEQVRRHAEDLAARLRAFKDEVGKLSSLVNPHYDNKRSRHSRSRSPSGRQQTVEGSRTTHQSYQPRSTNFHR